MSLSTLAEQPLLGRLQEDEVTLLLMLLPLDARLRAREVSRGWRALLRKPRFWLELDFSPESGVVARTLRALLFAAGERGRGHLHTLDLTGTEGLRTTHLSQFVAAHDQSLRSVTAPELFQFSADEVTPLPLCAPLHAALPCVLQCCRGAAPAAV